jgi:hypothetical protein
MPSNQEYKGKSMKGSNYDEKSGVGTSSAGPTGTVGNLNDGGRDGGVGSPDIADSGNLQSSQHGQPGGTPAQGNSQRGQQQGSSQQSGSQQQGNSQGDRGAPPLKPEDLGSDGAQQS